MSQTLNNFIYAITALCCLSTATAAPTACEALRNLPLPSGTIDSARDYSVDETVFVPAVDLGEPAPAELPDGEVKAPRAMCRVTGTIRPTARSYIRFEVWLPKTEWSGRFVQVGNGGVAGSIKRTDLVVELRDGNAAASTDDGTSSTNPAVGAAFKERPEAIADWGYRAVHLTAENAKTIVRTFYSGDAGHSYFRGCSKGGQEGLMEAQRYPEDFDGILSGDAPYSILKLIMEFAYNWQRMADPARQRDFVPTSLLPMLVNEVGRQCARAKLLSTDKYLSTPLACPFRPAALLCKDGVSDASCLTAAQVKSIEAVMAGPITSAGQQIFPGNEPEFYDPPESQSPIPGLKLYGWAAFLKDSLQSPPPYPERLAAGFLANAMDPPIPMADYDVDATPAVVLRRWGDDTDSSQRDLSKFAQRGGRLIMYEGLGDTLVPPKSVADYFSGVVDEQAKQTGTASSLEQTQKYLRLFMVPGLGHCVGGPGPVDIGQIAPVTGSIASHNVFRALQDWVERGQGPEKLIGTGTAQNGQPYTRPICLFPKVATYIGEGRKDLETSFTCVSPNQGKGH